MKGILAIQGHMKSDSKNSQEKKLGKFDIQVNHFLDTMSMFRAQFKA